MTREHDDDIVRRVDRTLTAVAEATPIAPPLADDLRELVELADTAARSAGAAGATGGSGIGAAADPMGLTDTADPATPLRPRHVGRNGHGLSPGSRPLALAAAVLAVALAAAATWMLRPNGDNPSAVQTVDGSERLEAGWLPGDWGTTEPTVTATDGLDVDLDAAVYRRQDTDGTVVMATGPMTAATADAAFEALNRLVRADETTNWGGSGDAIPSAELGFSTIAYGNSTGEENAAVVSPVRDEGVAPADVRADGWTTTPLPVDWVPGIAASQTVRYGNPVMGSSCRESAPICPDAWAEVTTTRGTLPDPDVLDVFLPNHGRMDVGDRTVSVSTWRDDPSLAADRGDAVVLVIWQEADGVIGSVMASGLDDEAVMRIVSDARVADDPDPVEPVRPVSLMDGGFSGVEIDGVALTFEAWEDSWRSVAHGPVATCWHVRVGDDPPLPANCTADSRPYASSFMEGVTINGTAVFGAVVGPEIFSLRAEEGTIESADLVSLVGVKSVPRDTPLPPDHASQTAQLAVVFATEANAPDVVISGLDVNDEVVGTVELAVE